MRRESLLVLAMSSISSYKENNWVEVRREADSFLIEAFGLFFLLLYMV